MKKFIALSSLALLIGLISCGGGGGGSYVYIDDDYYGWYDQDGYSCGLLGPGCNYNYFDGGFGKLTISEDPDYGWSGWDEYYSNYYGTYVEVGPSGIIYDADWGDALNKDDEVTSGRDVITSIALAQERSLTNAGKHYAVKFGLSQTKGLQLARTLQDFSVLKSRQEKDIADFAERLYGVKYDGLKAAVASAQIGDNSALDSVIGEAADNFNISAESMKSMVKSFHGKLLQGAGINL